MEVRDTVIIIIIRGNDLLKGREFYHSTAVFRLDGVLLYTFLCGCLGDFMYTTFMVKKEIQLHTVNSYKTLYLFYYVR